MKWPKTVPILTAKDICRNVLEGKNGSSDLIGWIRRSFNASHNRSVVYATLVKLCEGRPLVAFCDDTRHSKAKIAAAWNEAMRTLGYTEEVDA